MINSKDKGFTLVELAIVLVIVGLLVGGVLQGQELIKQAQIRSVITQIQSLDTSLNTFRAKYKEYPGDSAGASDYGINCPKAGVACSGSNDNVADVSAAGTDGVDGNGDGDFNLEDYDAAAVDDTAFDEFGGEIANFWVHLSNTLLVKGNFSQTDNCSTACGSASGVNFPDAAVGNGIAVASQAGVLYWILGTSITVIDFDGGAADADSPTAQTLTPEEAFGIDSKMDDGQPDNGIVQAIAEYNLTSVGRFTDDTDSGNGCFAAAGVYSVATELKLCTLRIKASG